MDTLAEVAALARGLLLGVALVALGTFLVAAVLLVGVVGSPILALAVAWLVLRHPRADQGRTPRRLRIASG